MIATVTGSHPSIDAARVEATAPDRLRQQSIAVRGVGQRAGDRVRVRAGERVPIDGKVVLGRSSVDQKAITGESVPILREPGDAVFAGTVNGEGTLEVEAAGLPGA